MALLPKSLRRVGGTTVASSQLVSGEKKALASPVQLAPWGRQSPDSDEQELTP
jgi:hypothetical protein